LTEYEYYEYGLEGFLPGLVVPLANRPEVDSWKGFEGLTIVRRKVTAGPWTEYTGEFAPGDRVQQVPESATYEGPTGTVAELRGERVRVTWDPQEGRCWSIEWPQHLRKV
jgi:hypothetical protein